MDSTFDFNSDEKSVLGELREVRSSYIICGIILYYPVERISENAMVAFFRRLQEAVPTPFSEPRFDDVRGILEGMNGWVIWSNVINGDPDGWRKHHGLIDSLRQSFVKNGELQKYGAAFRLLAKMFAAQTRNRAPVPLTV